MILFSYKFICFFLFSTPFASTINSYSYLLPKTEHSNINKPINSPLLPNTFEKQKFEGSDRISFDFSYKQKKVVEISKTEQEFKIPPPIHNPLETTNSESEKTKEFNDFYFADNLTNYSSKISVDLQEKKNTELTKNLEKKQDLKQLKEKFSAVDNDNKSNDTNVSDDQKKAQMTFMMSYEELATLKENFQNKFTNLTKSKPTSSVSVQIKKEENNEIIKTFIGTDLNTKSKEGHFFDDLLTDFWSQKSPNFDLRKEFIDEKMYVVVESNESNKLPKLFNGKRKKYSCAQENSVLDPYCEIYDFSSSKFSTGCNNEKIKSESHLKHTDLINHQKASKNKNNFVIRVSKAKYEALEKAKKDAFKVQTKNKKEAIQLKKQATLDSGLNEIFKSKTAVVKVVKVEGRNQKIKANETYKCEVKNKKYKCKLQKIDTGKNIEKFHEITKQKLKQNSENFVVDEYYFLSFEHKAFSIDEYKKAPIKISDSSNTEIGKVFFKEMALTDEDDPKKFIFVKEDNKTLLVSISLGKNENKNESLLLDGWQKLYKCSYKDSKQKEVVDEDCEIQILSYATPTQASSIANATSYALGIKNTSEIKPKSLYKLIIKDHDGFSPITLSKKTDNESIATLTNKFLIEEQKISGKTDLILGLIPRLNTNTPKINECKVGKEKVKCQVYSWGNSWGIYSAGRNKAKDFDYRQLEAIKSTNTNTCPKESNRCGLFVLKLEDPIFDISSNPEIEITVNNSYIYPFNVTSPLVGFINGGSSNIIYINDNSVLAPPVIVKKTETSHKQETILQTQKPQTQKTVDTKEKPKIEASQQPQKPQPKNLPTKPDNNYKTKNISSTIYTYQKMIGQVYLLNINSPTGTLF